MCIGESFHRGMEGEARMGAGAEGGRNSYSPRRLPQTAIRYVAFDVFVSDIKCLHV